MPFALRQIVSAALLCIVCTALIAAEHFHYGRFGTVAIYRPGDGDVRSVALLLSGDGGRDAGTVALAKRLAGLNTLVIGIDTRAYLQRLEGSAEACAQPWAELRLLAQAVERREGVSGYIWPMLVGQSSGASLAYAALVQAPTDTFKGGVAVEFCPELRMAKPLCKGDQPSAHPGLDRKGLVLDPVMQLNAPFSVLAGESTGTCDGARAKAFFAGMIGATSIPVGATERDSDGGNAWQGQFQEAYLRIAGSDASMRTSAVDEPAGLADLPLTEVVDKSARATDTFAIFFSGDGGWATLDAETSKRLAAAGVPVVGVSSLRYFWRERSPAQMASDLKRIVAVYGKRWDRTRFALLGYSLGADVAPFMASHLDHSTASHLAMLGLLAPGRQAAFQFHLSDWLGQARPGRPIEPEVAALGTLPVVCLYGADEAGESLCSLPAMARHTVRAFKGGHHFASDYDGVAAALLAGMGLK